MDKWTRLECKDVELPDLLIKCHFDNEGYTVQLTDLSRVWIESFSKKQIIRRAIKEDCSIDPSEGDDQLQIFHEKLLSAIRQEGGTSISLSSHDEDDLELQLSAPLPSPLPDFKWRVQLGLSKNERIERELVTPLIRQAQGLYRSIELLIAELHDKDRVISKITDRLEQSSNDLTTVFPGVSNIKTNRSKPQRVQLAKHVKGLADFDEESWRAQHRTITLDGPLPGDWTAILHELPPSRIGVQDNSLTAWWKDLKLKMDGGQFESSEISQTPALNAKRTTVISSKGDDDEMQDIEFQRQATPPRKHKASEPPVESASPVQARTSRVEDGTVVSRGSSQNLPTDGDETTDDDEDDLDAPSQKRPQPSQRFQNVAATVSTRSQDKTEETQKRHSPEKESRPSKLGVIGGRRLPAEPTVSNAKLSSLPEGRNKLGKLGGKTAKHDSPEPNSGPTKTSRKLGSLGGKTTANDTSRQQTATPPPQQTQRKFGTIGGRKGQAESDETITAQAKTKSEGPPSAGHNEATPGKSPSPEEDPATKAARKRDELKRQLEQQTKGPGKKKRKF